MYSYLPCPCCHQPRAERSRTRGLERLMKKLTSRRPYRCGACGWRGWCDVAEGNALRARPSLFERLRGRRPIH